MRSTHPDHAPIDDRMRGLLGFVRGVGDGANRGAKFRYQPFAHTLGWHLRVAAVTQRSVMQFGDKDTGAGAAQIENRDESVVALRHG
jgi:hypothetical protein